MRNLLRWLPGIFFGFAATAAPPAPVPRVASATDPAAVRLLVPDPARAGALVDAAVLRHTGARDLGAAWRRLVQPGDRVGIRIQTEPGPVMSVRPAVVEAVIRGLEQAGVPRRRILVFDRHAPQMEIAGYPPGRRADGVLFTATVPDGGYDPSAAVDLPIPGKLVWGDLDFRSPEREEEDQVSTVSHLSSILTRQVDRLVNIGVPMNDPDFGVYGCQLGASLSLADNFRRFHRLSAMRDDSLVKLASLEAIRKKTALHILDALIGQFAGGPFFDPQYCWPWGTVLASQDPLALDALALREINLQRRKASVPPIGGEAGWLGEMAAAGLGVADPEKVDLLTADPAR